MKRAIFPAAVGLALSAAASAAAPADKPIEWIRGPAAASIEDLAGIQVPEGYVFTGKDGTIRVMEMMGNLTTGREAGFLAPEAVFSSRSSESWFVVFEFEKIGYVKDDEKNEIDAAKLLAQMSEGVKASNAERKKRGLPAMEVVRWAVEPHYDEATNNLEWGLLLRTEDGGEVVNYEIRLLGRKGVMQCTLVLDSSRLAAALPGFRSLLSSYTFKSGHKYAEYRPGDRIAKIGLAALVAGGAAAVAAKTGLLKYVWKYLIFIVMAIVVFFKRIWRRYFGKQTSLDEDYEVASPSAPKGDGKAKGEEA